MNILSKSFGSVSVSIDFSKGYLSASVSGPSALSVSASADVADPLVNGVEKIIPGAIAIAVLEQARAALKAVQ